MTGGTEAADLSGKYKYPISLAGVPLVCGEFVSFKV